MTQMQQSVWNSHELPAEFVKETDRLAEWLSGLRCLVESSVGFCALKFANYLEAERQLFLRMSELRAACREARRLCRLRPELSPQIAERIHAMQATWLAIEDRLAEFNSQRSLLTALSGDLKTLENCQEGAESPMELAGDKRHICCTQRIERLDHAVHKKDDQLQQMLTVTSTISKVLDVICASDLLSAAQRDETPSSWRHSRSQRFSPEPRRQHSRQPSPSTTASTNFLPTLSQSGGDQESSSESSEIITQTGHNSALLGSTWHRNNNKASFASSESMETSDAESSPDLMATPHCLLPDSFRDSFKNSRESQIDVSVSALVESRLEKLTSYARMLQENVLATSSPVVKDVDTIDIRLRLLTIADATLRSWQTELTDLGARVRVQSCLGTAARRKSALLCQSRLASLSLLGTWIASLRNRCTSFMMELRVCKAKLKLCENI